MTGVDTASGAVLSGDVSGVLLCVSGATEVRERWNRFLRKVPLGVSMTYDLGVSAVDTTVPLSSSVFDPHMIAGLQV